jgi:hypothetical protein
MGRFLGSLVARGLVREAIVAGRSNSQPSYAPKIYSSDVLTVAQLAICLKQASKLDEDNERLEATRTVFLSSKSEIDLASAAVELQRPSVDHYSRKSVDAFNALIVRYNMLVTNGKAKQAAFNALVDAFNVQVDAYNATCVKRFYADDLPDAQKARGTTLVITGKLAKPPSAPSENCSGDDLGWDETSDAFRGIEKVYL